MRNELERYGGTAVDADTRLRYEQLSPATQVIVQLSDNAEEEGRRIIVPFGCDHAAITDKGAIFSSNVEKGITQIISNDVALGESMEKGKKYRVTFTELPIVLLLLLFLMGGCVTERNFVKFQQKKDNVAAGYCATWYPPKDSTHEKIVYKPGKPIETPGEVVYANCDSAYQAALDWAAAHGTKVKVPNLPVPCPPSVNRVDTVIDTKVVYVENTARVKDLTYKLAAKERESDGYKEDAAGMAQKSYLGRRDIGGIVGSGCCLHLF